MEKTREWKQYLMVILGSALFAASVNLLIVPLSLYSAGIVGIAQILRTLLVPLMPLSAKTPAYSQLGFLWINAL